MSNQPALPSRGREEGEQAARLLAMYEQTNFPELNVWAQMARDQRAFGQPLSLDVGASSHLLGKRASGEGVLEPPREVKRINSGELLL